MVEHYDNWHIARDDGTVVQSFGDDEAEARKVWDSDLYDRDEYRLYRNAEIVAGPGAPE